MTDAMIEAIRERRADAIDHKQREGLLYADEYQAALDAIDVWAEQERRA